jgi:hypothetical protein
MTQLRNAVRGMVAMAVGAVAALALPRNAGAQSCSPYGLIGADWTPLAGDLGPCTANEVDNGLGGRIENFEYGWINWTGNNMPFSNAAYGVWGLIGVEWVSRYGGFDYGQPITNQLPLPDYNYFGSGTFQYNEFETYSAPNTYYSWLVWNPPGSGLPCGNPGNVCGVWGTIGEAWWAHVNQSLNTLAAPTDDAYSVPGGAQQDFVTSGGQNGFITWNDTNNVACAFGYVDGGSSLTELWEYNSTVVGNCLSPQGNYSGDSFVDGTLAFKINGTDGCGDSVEGTLSVSVSGAYSVGGQFTLNGASSNGSAFSYNCCFLQSEDACEDAVGESLFFTQSGDVGGNLLQSSHENLATSGNSSKLASSWNSVANAWQVNGGNFTSCFLNTYACTQGGSNLCLVPSSCMCQGTDCSQ